MTKAQVEVITSVQRRRRWSRSEKEQIVAASMEPGAISSVVAREAGIHTSQLFRWRQQLCNVGDPAPTFTAVTFAGEPSKPETGEPTSCGRIEIELADGARVRISGAVEVATVSAVIEALTRSRR
jgi:transposase